MRMIWVDRHVEAPADAVWALLVDTDQWPGWGPSVRSASLDGDRLELGATGTVVTAVGPSLRFEITEYTEGISWAWRVAGIAATGHRVEPLGDGRCRVGFGVPWFALPYRLVCDIALKRIKTLAERSEVSS